MKPSDLGNKANSHAQRQVQCEEIFSEVDRLLQKIANTELTKVVADHAEILPASPPGSDILGDSSLLKDAIDSIMQVNQLLSQAMGMLASRKVAGADC